MDRQIFIDAKRQIVEDAAVSSGITDDRMLILAKNDLEEYLENPLKLREEFIKIGTEMGIKAEIMEKHLEKCISGYKKLYDILKMAIDENIKPDYERVKARIRDNLRKYGQMR